MAKIILDNLGLGLSNKNWVGYGDTYRLTDKYTQPGECIAGTLCNPFIYPGGISLTKLDGALMTNYTDIKQGIQKITGDLFGTSLLWCTFDVSSTTGDSAAVYTAHIDSQKGATSLAVNALIPGDNGTWPKIIDVVQSGELSNPKMHDIVNYQINGIPQTLILTTGSRNGNTEWDLHKIPYTVGNISYNSSQYLTRAGSLMTGYDYTLFSVGAGDRASRTFLFPSENGFCYLVNKNRLHKIDGTTSGGGTNGKITPNVLVMPDSYITQDVVENNGKMWLLFRSNRPTSAYSRGNAPVTLGVWGKDTTTIGLDNLYRHESLVNATALFVLEGIVHIFGYGADNIARIFAFDGVKLVVVKELGLSSTPFDVGSIGNTNSMIPVSRDGVIPYFGGIMWTTYYTSKLGNDTRYHSDLWWYGKLDKSKQSVAALFKLNESMINDDFDKQPALGTMSNTVLYATALEGPSSSSIPTVKVIAPMNLSVASSAGAAYFADIALPKLSVVTGVTIVMAGKASCGGNLVTTIKNKHTGQTQKTELVADIAERGYTWYQLGALERTNRVQLNLELSGTSSGTAETFPIIDRIEIEYDPTTRTI